MLWRVDVGKKETVVLRLLDQSKLAVTSISTPPCFRILDLLQNITPTSILLDCIDAWYGSTTLDGYTYMIRFQHCLPIIVRRQSPA